MLQPPWQQQITSSQDVNLIGERRQVHGCPGAAVLRYQQFRRRSLRPRANETERLKLEGNLNSDGRERPATFRRALRTGRNRLDRKQWNRRFRSVLLQC